MDNTGMKLEAQLILQLNQKLFANPRRMALLSAIADTGSVTQGAKKVGLSYKAAWDAVNDMNQRADEPLIILAVGGKGGGGAELTPIGERLVKLYSMLSEIQQRAVDALQDRSVPLESLLGAINQFSVQSSARNQYLGKVKAIHSDSGEVMVVVGLGSGLLIQASITQASCERLQLKPQREVMALIKAPAVTLCNDVEDKSVSHNCFRAVVISVSDQDVELQLESGDTLFCRFASEKLVVGQQVSLTIDPEQVMLAAMTP